MKWNYKCEKSFETRVEEAKQLKAIYKDSIPVKLKFYYKLKLILKLQI